MCDIMWAGIINLINESTSQVVFVSFKISVWKWPYKLEEILCYFCFVESIHWYVLRGSLFVIKKEEDFIELRRNSFHIIKLRFFSFYRLVCIWGNWIRCSYISNYFENVAWFPQILIKLTFENAIPCINVVLDVYLCSYELTFCLHASTAKLEIIPSKLDLIP